MGIDKGSVDLSLLGLGGFIISGTVAYDATKRGKWALVFSTLLSFNPLWMVINYIYLKNRWAEFTSEKLSRDDSKALENAGMSLRISKDIRLALFLSVAWLLCVPLFVFIFKPYGSYMRGNDTEHMFGVMFFPVIVGLALFFSYKKWVSSS